jgi:hypothetical protein
LPFKEFYRRNDDNRLGGTTKRKGNLSSAFEKDIFESRHSRTKTIFEDREKFAKKMALGIGRQRSILKIQKTTREAYLGIGVYQYKSKIAQSIW